MSRIDKHFHKSLKWARSEAEARELQAQGWRLAPQALCRHHDYALLLEREDHMRAADICRKAGELVGGERAQSHGAKLDNFERIAALWNGWIRARRSDGDFTAHDVGVMMALLKLARTQSGAFNIDDYLDAAGYAGCAAEVAQDLAAGATRRDDRSPPLCESP